MVNNIKSVFTRSADYARTGLYDDAFLTAPDVVTRGIVRLATLQGYGDARGTEGQPLFVPNVVMKSCGNAHDIIVFATMANEIYCFDANTFGVRWVTTVGMPIAGSTAIDAYMINDWWGVLSTGVINAAGTKMYICAWVSTDMTYQTGMHYLYCIDLTSGAVLETPLLLEGVTYSPPGFPVQTFKSMERKQRAALSMYVASDGKEYVIIPFGTLVESSEQSRGWLIAVQTEPMSIVAAITTTLKGFGAGIWQSGAGLATDPTTNLMIAITGNGTFDPPTDFGESIVAISFTPATATALSSTC